MVRSEFGLEQVFCRTGLFELTQCTRPTYSRLIEMLPCLDNYISYGHQVICSSQEHQAMMYDIIETVMNSERLGESDRVCACKLIESLLLNCRGHIDSYISPFLNLAFQFIFANSMKSVEFRVHCLEVVINSLHYNPALTIRILEENQWIKGFFSLWFQNVPKFSRCVRVGMLPRF